MKTCTKCKKPKDKNDFYQRKCGLLSSHCKWCIKEKGKEKRTNRTPEQVLKDKTRLEKYLRENHVHVKENRKKYWAKNKHKTRHNFLSNKYGISLEEYQDMYDKQTGLCAICFQEETATIRTIKKTLSVDHCHTTGIIRGLLCNRCNSALGLFKENEGFIQSALDYIRKHK